MPLIPTHTFHLPEPPDLQDPSLANWHEVLSAIHSQTRAMRRLHQWADVLIRQLNEKFTGFAENYNLLSEMVIPDYSNNINFNNNILSSIWSLSSLLLHVDNAGKSAPQSSAVAGDVSLAVTFTTQMAAAPVCVLLGIQELSDATVELVSVSAQSPSQTGFTARAKVKVAAAGSTFRFAWLPLGL